MFRLIGFINFVIFAIVIVGLAYGGWTVYTLGPDGTANAIGKLIGTVVKGIHEVSP